MKSREICARNVTIFLIFRARKGSQILTHYFIPRSRYGLRVIVFIEFWLSPGLDLENLYLLNSRFVRFVFIKSGFGLTLKTQE